MKHRNLVAAATTLFLLAVNAPLHAQDSESVRGQVTKVDPSAGKITIRHGPIKRFEMDEGMTMVFRAGNPAMLKSVKAGDKVIFVPDRINGQFIVTKIEKAR